ncbi:hypothetical protein C5748_23700 [Phyllobacterium phragmitis]|uniref:DUF1579 domain-containing protein n=1 Tax=Phyllobacterium phragmitis TaxID=2670329 RepID=A0A2S9IKG8_9HYPH|nr:DUF1579 domain-containing protein [Phyllobacterium phragmitis]PRD40992.1 hypothetical protein C5748_23700 [Phyllobacterium phragmitis]
MKAEPQKEHHWLQQLVGEWTCEMDAHTQCPEGSDAEASGAESSGEEGSTSATWTESVRSLHGLWVVGEGKGEMPQVGPVTTILTIGYDPHKKRYVGTWIGSMMTYLWIYDGWLDETGKVLTLEAEGPDFTTEGKMAKYRDIITIKDNDYRLFTAEVLGDDGEWREMMRVHYRRKDQSAAHSAEHAKEAASL